MVTRGSRANAQAQILDSNQDTGAAIELVFGFVGPTGIDLDRVCESLRSQLRAVSYDVVEIRLSELISIYLGKSADFANGYERIKTLMERGTQLREKTDQANIVARLGVAKLRQSRLEKTGDVYKPAARVAYLIRSFKRPEEVELFRQVYGKAFTLVSVYASRTWRLQFLRKVLGPTLGAKKALRESAKVATLTYPSTKATPVAGARVALAKKKSAG